MMSMRTEPTAPALDDGAGTTITSRMYWPRRFDGMGS
jgi:hypothetical protein